MKVLITGGTGYIASHTVVELIKKGHDCVLLDNLSNSNIAVLKRVEKITGILPTFCDVDIRDKEALEKVFNGHSFDAVIHFAGLKAVGESVSLPLEYYENNVYGSANLYSLMSKYHVNNLVFSSSATVYGDSFPVPLKESYGYGKASNPYGETKLVNEMMIKDVCVSNKDLSAIILRYFNPVGAHESGLLGEAPNGIPNNLMPYIADVACGKRPFLHVYGNDYDTVDGTGVRDYIHVVDLARAHVLALEYAVKQKGADVFNIGTGNGYSVLEVVKAYEKACGHEIKYVIEKRRPGDVASSYADPTKSFELLGFKAEHDINDMCRDSYNFIINNGDGIK